MLITHYTGGCGVTDLPLERLAGKTRHPDGFRLEGTRSGEGDCHKTVSPGVVQLTHRYRPFHDGCCEVDLSSSTAGSPLDRRLGPFWPDLNGFVPVVRTILTLQR